MFLSHYSNLTAVITNNPSRAIVVPCIISSGLHLSGNYNFDTELVGNVILDVKRDKTASVDGLLLNILRTVAPFYLSSYLTNDKMIYFIIITARDWIGTISQYNQSINSGPNRNNASNEEKRIPKFISSDWD